MCTRCYEAEVMRGQVNKRSGGPIRWMRLSIFLLLIGFPSILFYMFGFAATISYSAAAIICVLGLFLLVIVLTPVVRVLYWWFTEKPV